MFKFKKSELIKSSGTYTDYAECLSAQKRKKVRDTKKLDKISAAKDYLKALDIEYSNVLGFQNEPPKKESNVPLNIVNESNPLYLLL